MESGAALGVSTGGLSFNPNTFHDISYKGDPATASALLANAGDLAADVLAYGRRIGLTDTEASFLRINPGGGTPSLDYNAMNAYYAQHPLTQNAGNTATPTPSYMIPSTPVAGYNSGGSAMVNVTAVNPTSRSVSDGIIIGLRQVGVKV